MRTFRSKLPILATAVSIALLIYSVFFSQSSIEPQEIIEESGILEELAGTVEITQELSILEPFDRIGFHIATYTQTFTQGSLRIVLMQNGIELTRNTIQGPDMVDHAIIWLNTPNAAPGEYQVRLIIEGFESGHAPTFYVSDALSCTRNGEELGYGLAYQTCTVTQVFSTEVAVICLGLSLFWLTNRSKRPIFATAVSIALLIYFVFFSPSSFKPQEIMEESGVLEELVGTVEITQDFSILEPFDRIGFRGATYMQSFTQGSVRIVLTQNGKELAVKTIQGPDMVDNATIWLDTPNAAPGEYQVRLITEGFESGHAPTFFISDALSCTRNGEEFGYGLAYRTSASFRVLPVDSIVVAVICLGLSLLWLTEAMEKKQHKKAAIVAGTAMLALVSALCLCAYLVTGTFHPQGFLALCGTDPEEVEEQVFENLDVSIKYIERWDGSAYQKFYNILMDQVNQKVVTVTVEWRADAEKKAYPTSALSQSDINQEESIFKLPYFVYEGQPTSTFAFDIPYCEWLRLDYVKAVDFDEDLYYEEDTQVAFTRIILNDRAEIARLQGLIPSRAAISLLTVLCFLAFILACKKWDIPQWLLDKLRQWKFSPKKQFLLWGGLLGMVFLLLLPFYHAPDEPAHLNMIGSELGYPGLYPGINQAIGKYMHMEVVQHPGDPVPLEDYLNALSVPFEEPLRRTSLPSIQILRHLPQAIGVQVAIFLGLPPFWIFLMGRLGALLFYLGVGYCTLRLMPYKKMLMMTIMLIPQVMQQTASLSYDCMLISMSFLLIAYILHLRECVEFCGWKELAAMGGMLLPIAVTKINYSVLFLLVLLIPLDKWRLKMGRRTLRVSADWFRRHKALTAGGLLAVCAGGVAVLSRITAGKRLLAFALSPVQSVRLILHSLYENSLFYLKGTFANFGWVDTNVPWYTIVLIIFALLLSALAYEKGREKETLPALPRPGFRVVDRGLMLVCALLVVVTCFVGMFGWSMAIFRLSGTNTISGIKALIPQIPSIIGVQGRYFIPALPPLLLVLPQIKRLDEAWVNVIRSMIQVVVTASVVFTLVNRFWI